LFLAAGKAADARVAFLLELHQGDHFRGPRAAPEEASEQAHGFEDGELVGKLGVLQLDSEPLPQLGGVGVPAHAQQLDFARIRIRQALADLNGGGFAGPVGAEQAEALGGSHLEVEVVHRHHILVCLAKMADAERGPRGGG